MNQHQSTADRRRQVTLSIHGATFVLAVQGWASPAFIGNACQRLINWLNVAGPDRVQRLHQVLAQAERGETHRPPSRSRCSTTP